MLNNFCGYVILTYTYIYLHIVVMNLYSHPIIFSENKTETNTIRIAFYQMASDWYEKIKNDFYKLFDDLDDLYKNADDYANRVRMESITQGMKVLAAHGIYDITEQYFYEHFMSAYDTWDENFGIIANQYEAIVERTEELHAHRTARRQNRDKWVGYNAEGRGAAMAKNLGSNIGHGVFNLAAAGFNAIGDAMKKNDIFKNQSTLNQVADGLYNIVIAAFHATMDAVNAEKRDTFYCYSNEEISRVQAIVESIRSDRIPQDNILPSLIKAIQLYPYNREIYLLLLSRFGDNNRSLDEVVNYFGLVSLTSEKKQIFETRRSKVSLVSLEDCKMNLPILEEYAQSIGYEDFQEESKILLETAFRKEFEKQLSITDLSTISACRANLPNLQNFANEIDYKGFEKQSTEILNRAIENDFKLQLASTNLATVAACKINLPILQEFANEINYKGFEAESIEILNRAIENDFLLEAAKYQFKTTKDCEANFPKLEAFATEIGYTKFAEWSAQVQTKAKPKTTVIVVLVYLIALIIGSWALHEPLGIIGFVLCSWLFVIGLIAPKLVLWYGERTRLRSMKIYGLLTLFSLITAIMFIK